MTEASYTMYFSVKVEYFTDLRKHSSLFEKYRGFIKLSVVPNLSFPEKTGQAVYSFTPNQKKIIQDFQLLNYAEIKGKGTLQLRPSLILILRASLLYFQASLPFPPI